MLGVTTWVMIDSLGTLAFFHSAEMPQEVFEKEHDIVIAVSL